MSHLLRNIWKHDEARLETIPHSIPSPPLLKYWLLWDSFVCLWGPAPGSALIGFVLQDYGPAPEGNLTGRAFSLDDGSTQNIALEHGSL